MQQQEAATESKETFQAPTVLQTPEFRPHAGSNQSLQVWDFRRSL